MPTIEQARAWYSLTDPVHGFDHVARVYLLAEHLALAEGADVEVVRAAALLHDAQGDRQGFHDDEAPDEEIQRLKHHHNSAEFARQVLEAEGWTEARINDVQHCIRAHRFRDEAEQPQTLEGKVLFDADKLDAIGATGVARAIAFAVKAGKPAYARPSQTFLQTGQREADEMHSAYHEFVFKLIKIKDRLYTPTGQALAAERHKLMVEFFARLEAEMRDTG